ncbi:MAG TPA: DUF1501 domain-containing protein [Verrucomicrobiales bacterium]|nr:DUF1501 domain-containing protein [Verrucomicrobiales bacterium]HIL72506.1 DUF1501 domain-containing protein [Verrucomicrobiota bacterium]
MSPSNTHLAFDSGDLSRREMLRRTACGFGSLALAGISADTAIATNRPKPVNPLSPIPPHLTPKAERIIFIFMQGGPSHVDTFDFKPKLIEDHEKEVPIMGYRFNDFRTMTQRTMMKPLWDFKQYGQCGRYVSDLFPNVARHVDDLCFLHGMHTEGVAHGPATLFLHTGSINQIRPSMGSWISYGLGTVNENMPSFVTLMPTERMGGPQNYGNAFLPAVHQGTSIGRANMPASEARIKNIANPNLSASAQARQFRFLQDLNRAQFKKSPNESELEAAVNSFELAYRMQLKAPGLLELSGESESTKRLYGIGEKPTNDFGKQCLMARRLTESGVRFVQVNYSDNDGGNPRWDQHSNMPLHETHARAVDKPIAGLLADLKSRGLLENTLVWWGGEFGRTPFSQNKDGRDHNSNGFTVWLAGGGVKPGIAYGSTDEYGYMATENKIHMHDLHATILHLMGLNHKNLTYRHAGRDFRLTDVYGQVATEIIA